MPLSRIVANSISTGSITGTQIANNTIPVEEFANTGTVAIFSPSTNNLAIRTTSTNRIVIDSSGYIASGNTIAGMRVGNFTVSANTGPSSGVNNNWVGQFGNSTGTAAVLLGWRNYTGSGQLPVIGAQSTTALVIQPDGGQTLKPNQSAFVAYPLSTTTANPVAFDGIALNIGNHYNTSTNRYTAPETGMYFFNLVWTYDGVGTSSGFISLSVNGNRTRDLFEAMPGTTTNTEWHSSVIFYLTKNDYVQIQNANNIEFQGGSETFYSLFQGYFLG